MGTNGPITHPSPFAIATLEAVFDIEDRIFLEELAVAEMHEFAVGGMDTLDQGLGSASANLLRCLAKHLLRVGADVGDLTDEIGGPGDVGKVS